MQNVTPRPVLRSFRAVAFKGHNRGDANGVEMRLDLRQDIELGLAVPTAPGAPLLLAVRIELNATATNERDASDAATFSGEYEAKFYYAGDVAEESVAPLLESPDYQYVLVAQAYPLAMTHFRRELQAMGLDARQLPLGVGA